MKVGMISTVPGRLQVFRRIQSTLVAKEVVLLVALLGLALMFQLEVPRANFTNCGIEHKYTENGYELSQHSYISALKPIRDVELTGMPNDHKVDLRLAR